MSASRWPPAQLGSTLSDRCHRAGSSRRRSRKSALLHQGCGRRDPWRRRLGHRVRDGRRADGRAALLDRSVRHRRRSRRRRCGHGHQSGRPGAVTVSTTPSTKRCVRGVRAWSIGSPTNSEPDRDRRIRAAAAPARCPRAPTSRARASTTSSARLSIRVEPCSVELGNVGSACAPSRLTKGHHP